MNTFEKLTLLTFENETLVTVKRYSNICVKNLNEVHSYFIPPSKIFGFKDSLR